MGCGGSSRALKRAAGAQGGRRAGAGEGWPAALRRGKVGGLRWKKALIGGSHLSGRRERDGSGRGGSWAKREIGPSVGKEGRERRKESWAGPREEERERMREKEREKMGRMNFLFFSFFSIGCYT
jgi:hypothetical protein